MIKDSIERADVYYNISNNLRNGFEWIKNVDLNNISDGRYDLSDGNYANVQTYTTKDDALFEAHRNYIDIQYVVEGEEQVGVVDYSVCSVGIEYDEEKDIEFLTCNLSTQYIKIKKGEFLVLFPHDAHKPSIKIDENKLIKKIVVKVKI